MGRGKYPPHIPKIGDLFIEGDIVCAARMQLTLSSQAFSLRPKMPEK